MTAPPRWQHVITDAGHHLRLTGANGEPILTSEVYVDGAGVADALVLARRATSTWSGQQPDLVDQRTPGRDLYAAALADGHYPDEDPAAVVGDEAGVRTVIIPGPLSSQGPRVDRGPGHEAE